MLEWEVDMISLRKASFDDCALFNIWENDERVINFLSISKGRTMEETVREFFVRESDASMFDFVVLHEGRAIGRAYLSRYDKNSKSVDITRIYIGEMNLRGKGLGRELMEKLLEFCFEEFGLHRVTLDYFDGNPAQELYKSMGFQSEGVAREAGFKDGKYNNFNLMSLLKREWEEIRLRKEEK